MGAGALLEHALHGAVAVAPLHVYEERGLHGGVAAPVEERIAK